MDRRDILRGLGLIGASASFPRIAFAQGGSERAGDKRLVVIMLRGAMDGLSAAPAYGDPNYARARNGIATPPPGSVGGALDLDGFFGLDPALSGLQARFAKKEVIVFHAIASPYRDRSHFDGQNLLENGSGLPYGLADGWLNRALGGLPERAKTGRSDLGIALAPAMPLMLRGPSRVTSWSPSILPGPGADLVARLQRLYAETDPKLASALSGAADANANVEGARGAGGEAFVTLMSAAARFMSEPNGPRVAMVESTGWDTHTGQLGPYGVLPRNLGVLDRGVEALAQGLGARWSSTAVVVVTEFGRTVAMNGTGGTDHGTGGAAFLIGGAVNGGRVIADWPGLGPQQLYEGRDLRPTTDVRSVLKAALVDHLGVDAGHVDRIVFPQSAEIQTKPGLFRT
jgi:uncharacterized protein (DUF1501 family)